jgi:nucleotide-binding universal stress UspA family protein
LSISILNPAMFGSKKESKGVTMFDTILVPLDGSQLAECVLPHVAAFARSFNAEITLLRILEKNQTGVSVQLFDMLNWQIQKTKATLYLEEIKTRFEESKIRARAIVLEGLVTEGINDYAQKEGIKLIILSSHGRHGLTQWGISSITQKIVLSAPTSVLIVQARQQNFVAGELSNISLYRNILVPLDGSQRAEHVLPVIMQLALVHNPKIHLVHVVHPPEMARQMPPVREDVDLSNRVVARNREEAEHYFEQVKSRSYLEGIDVQSHLITSDHTTAALYQVVEQENIDMVTLSAHGYSGKHQWPYGSVVNNFILYGNVALLIVQDQPAKHEQKPLASSSRERAER